MINFLFGMLVMYLISGFCWMGEDFFAPSCGWYTPLPDIFYKPIKIFFNIICNIVISIQHPIIATKYYFKKIKKFLTNNN